MYSKNLLWNIELRVTICGEVEQFINIGKDVNYTLKKGYMSILLIVSISLIILFSVFYFFRCNYIYDDFDKCYKDITDLKSLNLINPSSVELDKLSKCSELKELFIFSNDRDFSLEFLLSLDLYKLTIHANPDDWSCLGTQHNMAYLIIVSNSFNASDVFYDMKKLKKLEINTEQSIDLSKLKYCSDLDYLLLQSNNYDLSELSDLNKVEELRLVNMHIDNVDFLGKMKSLSVLKLPNTSCGNYCGLIYSNNLKSIYVDDKDVIDSSIVNHLSETVEILFYDDSE